MLSTREEPSVEITTGDMATMVRDPEKADIVARLYQLTNTGGSAFRDYLDECKQDPAYYLGRIKVLMAWRDSKIVGWCIVRDVNHPFTKDFGVFCDPEYRRQGIGSALLHAATGHLTDEQCLSCYPWNDTGKAFFASYWQQDQLAIYNR